MCEYAPDRSCVVRKKGVKELLLQGQDTACQHIAFVEVRDHCLLNSTVSPLISRLHSSNASHTWNFPTAVCTKLIKLEMGTIRNLTVLVQILIPLNIYSIFLFYYLKRSEPKEPLVCKSDLTDFDLLKITVSKESLV